MQGFFLTLCLTSITIPAEEIKASEEPEDPSPLIDYNINIRGGYGVHINVNTRKARARDIILMGIISLLPPALADKLLSMLPNNEINTATLGHYSVEFDYDEDWKDWTRSGSFSVPADLDVSYSQFGVGKVTVEVSIGSQSETRTGTIALTGFVTLH